MEFLKRQNPKQGILPLFFVVIMAAVPATGSPVQGSAGQDTAAHVRFARAESLVLRGDTAEAIAELQKLVRFRPGMGSAHHRLARLRIDRGGLENRIRAQWDLDRALALEPDNPAFLSTQGYLYLISDMSNHARRCYKKVIQKEPKNADAYLWLGYISEQEWIWYRDMISRQVSVEGTPVLTFTTRQYALRDLQDAMTCYGQAVFIDPGCRDGWRRLAFLHFEDGSLDSMVQILERAVHYLPEEWNVRLFLGLAYQRMGSLRDAGRQYEAARAMMGPEDKALFENPDWIGQDASLEPGRKRAFKGPATRKPEVASFWKSRDPLFLTDVNERLMEHYGRMAYAGLRFARLRDGIQGWNTDPGRAMIRYGRPLWEYKTRPADNHETKVFSTSWSRWMYPGFSLTFVDRTLRSRFVLDDRAEYNETVRKTPESYTAFSENQEFGLVCTTALFQDSSGQAVLDVFESLPEADAGLARGTVLKRGVFLFDPSWKETARIVDKDPFFMYPAQSILAVAWNRLPVKPGTCHLAVEMMDEAKGKVGRWRQTVNVPVTDDIDLALSDLVVLRESGEYRSKGEWRRGGLRMIPNTLETYGLLSDVPLYFEIYNLAFRPGGRTRFRVTQAVTPLEPGRSKSILDLVKKWSGKDRERGQVRTSFEAEGESRSETVLRILQIEHPLPGSYRLEVLVEDLVSGQSAKKEKVITFKGLE